MTDPASTSPHPHSPQSSAHPRALGRWARRRPVRVALAAGTAAASAAAVRTGSAAFVAVAAVALLVVAVAAASAVGRGGKKRGKPAETAKSGKTIRAEEATRTEKGTTGYTMGTTTSDNDPVDRGRQSDAGRERGAPPCALWRMRTTVVDEPGALASLCTALAGLRVDILALQTHPLGGTTVDEFLLRAPGRVDGAALTAAVGGAGGRGTWLERAHAHDLVDTPTRVLGMATRTAQDASELPLALRELLGRSRIRSFPSTPARGGAAELGEVPPEGCFEETVLRLPDPQGGTIVVERPDLPFTPTEFARARALVELDARLGQRVPRRREALALPEGGSITVRRADVRDLAEATAMHRRCTAGTLRRRYHGPVGDADRYLRHLLSPRFGRTLAVETPEGRIVALGHLLWDGEETEVALLVEDEWQGRGIGAELLRRLAALAVEARSESIYAVTQAGNSGMIATMRGLGLPLDYQFEGGTVVISAPLAPAAAPAPQTR